jgi:S-adenosylmethionine:tRNA ribosyltransferase-isomerase
MRVDQFDFDLPGGSIALRPASPRDGARMLVVRSNGTLIDSIVRDLPHWLEPGDALVVNDTRVIPAKLTGVRERSGRLARVEATLHKREGADRWRAFVRGQKKLSIGDRIRFGAPASQNACALAGLDAEVREKQEGGEVLLAFELFGPALDEAIELLGRPPLPPYIASRRQDDAADRDDYQTMFATHPGAVAAPTAGLHFTPSLLGALRSRGIELCRVTLHVGAGTFLPMKEADTAAHVMHAETAILEETVAERLNAVRRRGGRIVAVGSTTLRVLESAADVGGTIRPMAEETALFITPGYRFRAVDVLMTNFHLPRSTLLVLVAAFSGLMAIRSAYTHAIAGGYRFYSYGDACLLFGRRLAP